MFPFCSTLFAVATNDLNLNGHSVRFLIQDNTVSSWRIFGKAESFENDIDYLDDLTISSRVIEIY